jgi:CDP-diacylglycerol--glycerol-3-phosphate 3-phosphatidyltransferase
VPLCYALFNSLYLWVLVLALTGALTDFLDGYFARKFNQVTELGKIIDPIADKIMVGSGALALLWAGKLPLWFLLIVVLRDVLILLGGIFAKKRKGVTLMSNNIGKYTVAFVALALLSVGLGWNGISDELLYGSSLAMILSFVVYLLRFLDVIKQPDEIST